MKILHIPQENIGLKKSVGGVKSVLLEEIKWENRIENTESRMLIYDKIEENNLFFINKKSLQEDILDYKPDFVIFDGFYVPQHCFIAKFLKKHRIKYYIKPHSGFNNISQKKSKFKFIKKLIARFLLFDNYVKNSNGLIFLNEMEKQNSIYHNKNEFILPNGIDTLDIKFNCIKEQSENIRFIFLGRIDIYHKGLDILFDVLSKNKEYFKKNKVIFNFYGKGTKKDMIKFNNLINQIPEIVKFYGPIYGNDKYKVLQKNNIFILTSRYEGMPMGILEALSIGLPCFISKETGMGECIEKYNVGWVNKNKEKLFEDLKKCVENYKKDKSIYLYEANFLKCIDSFHWKNIIKIYKSEYSVMNNNK